MDLIANLALGFGAALTIENCLYAFVGVTIGTLIGVLPGLGPVATIAMLLPVTYALAPLPALIMLAGIYYGAQYGGSTTAILVNIPGETGSVVTCIDGYQMARQGRGGVALTTAAVGSFFAGSVATLLLAAFAPLLAGVALEFGAPEYFSLMVLGLVGAVVLASGSLLKAFAMIALGLLGGLIGTDINSGAQRYTFGLMELSDGIEFAIVALGLFAFTEVMINVESKERREAFTNAVSTLWPSKDDIRRMILPILRGTGLGSILGILPGGGATISSFAAYSLEKKVSRDPDSFGRGAIEGVAGPESANNAAAQMSFVPLLTLGLPSNSVMALMIGAMMIHNIQPGPNVMTSNPELFWGLIASMWIGNAVLVLLNLPLIGIWVKLLKVPYKVLYPAIVVFCCIGIYSLSNSVFDVVLTAVFALLGYIFSRLDCPPAPLMLGFILGPMMEENFRRSMLLSRGDVAILFTHPISGAMLALAAILLIIVLSPSIRRKREVAFQE